MLPGRRWGWWCGGYGKGVVECRIRKMGDRVMLVFEEDVLRLICEYALQSGKF